MILSTATHTALELPSLLALLAAEARTDLGAARLRALSPTADVDELRDRRTAFDEVARLAVEAPLVPSFDEPLAPLLDRLETDRPPLDGAEIVLVAGFLSAADEAARRIAAADAPCRELARRLEGLGDPAPLVGRIRQVLDRQGRVRDDASPRLVALARQVQVSRERIYAELDRVRSAHGDLLSEETTPLRGGRVLLLLSAGSRGRLPGLVHGRSASGQSFYFEPLETVEENNALASAVDEVESERLRLVRELLAALVAELPLVERFAALLGELDALETAGRFAAEVGGRLAEVAPPGRVRLLGARHPLLDPRLAERRERVLGNAGHRGRVVPLELELSPERRLLVVTGPNAGGKTVALKTLGLLALLHQCGLPVPCAAGSELPCFASVVATIGDEQDLLAERSTFSGRLERLGEAWRAASPNGLTLLDELGSGTDPEEGAALAVALVEHLVGEGGLGVVTTHLAQVALAALDRTGAACAAMEFDPASGQPSFRLRPGAPGASEALALARRLDLPAEWIARAESLVSSEHRELGRILGELESARGELERASTDARHGEAEAARVAEALERERAALEAERRVVGRKLEARLEAFRERVSRDLAGELERLRVEFASGRRRRIDREAVDRLFAEAPELAPADETSASERPIVEGAAVRHRALGWRGTLERLDGSRAEVVVAGKRLVCDIAELLASTTEPEPRRGAVARPVSSAGGVGGAELKLLGRTVEEALAELDAHLDRALLDGLESLRIVHGHGTGRLRDAVREHLRRHPAVAAHRAGAPNEGGNGATIVTLRG